MAYIPKTQEEFQTALSQFIKDYNTAHGTNYDTRNGTVLKDILIDAPSSQYAMVSTDLQGVSQTQSVNYASTMSIDDLTDLGSNYGLTLGVATPATGAVYFVTYIEPSFDIVISAGTLISTPATSTSSSQSFQTTENVVMYSANPDDYKFTDPELNIGWRISATIRALVAGVAGNVASNTITNLNQSIAGITSVYNDLPTLGGTDTETNESFGNRIKIKLSGNNVGTSNGIASLILTNPQVEDVSIVGPRDPEMKRNQYGGSVDAYVLGSNIVGFTEEQIYSSIIGYIQLVHTPVISVASVTGIVGGIAHTFVLGTEAVFVKDVGLLAGSTSEISTITFPTIVKPDDGTQVAIVLTYDSLIPVLQGTINLSENTVLASDVLVRECIVVIVNVYAEITIFSGYAAADVAAAVKTEVTTYLNSPKLNVSIVSSDLIRIIDGIAGVNSVSIPTFLPATDIPIGKNEVSEAGTVAVKIGNTLY